MDAGRQGWSGEGSASDGGYVGGGGAAADDSKLTEPQTPASESWRSDNKSSDLEQNRCLHL